MISNPSTVVEGFTSALDGAGTAFRVSIDKVVILALPSYSPSVFKMFSVHSNRPRYARVKFSRSKIPRKTRRLRDPSKALFDRRIQNLTMDYDAPKSSSRPGYIRSPHSSIIIRCRQYQKNPFLGHRLDRHKTLHDALIYCDAVSSRSTGLPE
jgi:hypothetical protein